MTKPRKKIKFQYGTVNTPALYIRAGAGKEFQPIQENPIIKQDTKVKILNTIVNDNKEEWYYIKLNDNVYGYVKAEFIQK